MPCSLFLWIHHALDQLLHGLLTDSETDHVLSKQDFSQCAGVSPGSDVAN